MPSLRYSGHTYKKDSRGSHATTTFVENFLRKVPIPRFPSKDYPFMIRMIYLNDFR